MFDYSEPWDHLTGAQRAVFEDLAARVSAAGEPFPTYFKPADLMAEIRAVGFADVEDLTGEALMERYFAGRSDGLRLGRMAHVFKARMLTPASGSAYIR